MGSTRCNPCRVLHGKFGLNFDWGSKDQFVKALECGAMLDLYYKRVPVLVNNSNRFYTALGFIFLSSLASAGKT
jgi:hypothetical protein